MKTGLGQLIVSGRWDNWPAAPMVLGLVLGTIFENSPRRSLTLSHGSPAIVLTRPISAILLACALLAVLAPWIARLAGRRKTVCGEMPAHGVRAGPHAGHCACERSFQPVLRRPAAMPLMEMRMPRRVFSSC